MILETGNFEVTYLIFVKVMFTTIAIVLVFPQLFLGYSMFTHKLTAQLKQMRWSHKILGRVLISIYVIVSLICFYFFNPDSLPHRVLVHSIIGVIGYVAIPAKLYFIHTHSAYRQRTRIAGLVIVACFIGLFLTSVFFYYIGAL
jgi:hypothetical protein